MKTSRISALVPTLLLALLPRLATAQERDQERRPRHGGGDENVATYERDERQGPTIGFDVGPNFVVVDDDISDDSAGIGVAGRLGYRLTAGFLDLTPEAKLGFESPGTPNAFQAMGGLRVGLDTRVSPVAFAHAGGLLGDLEGFVWDAGGGVVVNFDEISVGAEVSYNRTEEQDLDFDNVEGRPDARGNWEWVRANATISLNL